MILQCSRAIFAAPWLLAFAASLGWSAMSAAAVPKLQDFAFGAELNVDASAAVHAVTLPDFVYLASRQAGLADVRVFNASGGSVPVGFRDVPRPVARLEEVKVPLFALSVPIESDERRESRQANDSAANLDAAATMALFVLDTGKVGHAYSGLRLVWPVPEENFSHRIAIEQSSDLVRWKPLLPETSLTHMHSPGAEAVVKNEARFRTTTARYLRLRPLTPNAAQALPVIDTAYVRYRLRPPPSATAPLVLTPLAVAEQTGRFEFELPYGMPVTHLRITTDTDGVFAKVQFWNRTSRKADWRRVGQARVFSLGGRDAQVTNKRVSIRSGHGRFWAITPLADTPASALAAPRIELSWKPQQLLFVGTGSGPFTLAYGTSLKQPPHREAARFLSEFVRGRDVRTVSIGAAREIAGTAAYAERLDADTLKSWALWAVLIAAVLGLLWMARSLLREPDPTTADGTDDDAKADRV
jgi:hypothetical protein